MFDIEEIIEFFNRIINAPNISNQEIKRNIIKFYEYLVLTKMCDEETLKEIYKLVACINEILIIKERIGYIDLNNLLLEPQEPKKLTKKPLNKKHYSHYESEGPSFCGSSSSSSSYSCSCGSGSYTSRC